MFTRRGYGLRWSSHRPGAQAGTWAITLDTYTVRRSRHSHVTYTRMRAPYVNPQGFRFTIYRKAIFSELGKLFGGRISTWAIPASTMRSLSRGTPS